ncbi:MAG TPA: M56 family metallopeptidase [Longimicrobium sp.]|nr:M56 family metallopeptidase [Longimicrobium sp.]
MTAQWVIRAIAAGVLLAAAAVYAERAAGWLRVPRRWIWAAAMAATLLLPLLVLAVPGLLPRMDAAPDAVAMVTAAPAEAMPAVARAVEEGASLPWARIFVIGWLVASGAMLGVLGGVCRRMDAGLRGLPGARLYGVPVRVAERAGPAVAGVLMPEIVVPRWLLDAPEAEARRVVWHEREHVAAGDAQLLALAALAVAAMPWNPALWWQQRRLRLAVETDCDARVLAVLPGVRPYAHALLRAAAAPAPSMLALSWGGRANHLERRIAAMTAPRPRLPRALATAAAAGCLLAAACGVMESEGATADTRHAAVPRVVDEGVDENGRTFRVTDNADGTERIDVGPDPNVVQGDLGLSWKMDNMRGWRPGEPLPEHPYVGSVRPGSPASDAGLAPNDTILSANDRDSRLGNIFPDRAPGTLYTLRVRRNGVERETRLTVGAVPQAPVP